MNDDEKAYNVLFLCTGNSARSILAESLLSRRGGRHFRAFSAGSHPTGRVNPTAIATLQQYGFPTEGLRSKSWNDFAGPQSAPLDFVFTVCDNAAGETCPLWPGQPMTAHWGVPDPAAVKGTEVEIHKAFEDAFRVLERRISLFISLPIRSLDQLALSNKLRDIGKA